MGVKRDFIKKKFLKCRYVPFFFPFQTRIFKTYGTKCLVFSNKEFWSHGVFLFPLDSLLLTTYTNPPLVSMLLNANLKPIQRWLKVNRQRHWHHCLYELLPIQIRRPLSRKLHFFEHGIIRHDKVSRWLILETTNGTVAQQEDWGRGMMGLLADES